METLFNIKNLFQLRPFLNSDHHLVNDGGVLLSVREWAYWSDKNGIPNRCPELCTPIDEEIDTDNGRIIYPLGEPVGSTTTGEDAYLINQLFN